MRPKAAIIGADALSKEGKLHAGSLRALLAIGAEYQLYLDASADVAGIQTLTDALATEPGISVRAFKDPSILPAELLKVDIELSASVAIALPEAPEGCTHFAWSDWATLTTDITAGDRRAAVSRGTKETSIQCKINLDQGGVIKVHTGLAFFDHMLEQIAKHAGISMDLRAEGDLEVDAHHTVEDVGLVVGEALKQALGNKRGIARFGASLPMDEAKCEVLLDLSGRPFAKFEGALPGAQVGDLPCEMVPHFFRSFSDALGCNLHIRVEGENTHHMVEIAFKGLGRALRQAVAREGDAIPSTKGSL